MSILEQQYGNIDETKGVQVQHTGTVLDEIVDAKKKELKTLKEKVPLQQLLEEIEKKPSPSSFREALQLEEDIPIKLITEFKVASPSKGLFFEDFDAEETPPHFFQQYKQFGASALSVITEQHFFKGSFDYLEMAAGMTGLPILCKDFIFDPYQLYFARSKGASAVLLIAALLPKGDLERLLRVTKALSMDALVETHTKAEVSIAVEVGADIIGINNRNLKTFKTSLTTTEQLTPHIPKGKIIVAESGIKTREDALKMQSAGAYVLLVGETLITSNDVREKMSELLLTV